MVLCGEHEVFGAGGLNHAHPLIRVELDGIERPMQTIVKLIIDALGDSAVAGVVGSPTVARPTHRARQLARWVPVHEHAEAVVLPLFDHRGIGLQSRQQGSVEVVDVFQVLLWWGVRFGASVVVEFLAVGGKQPNRW